MRTILLTQRKHPRQDFFAIKVDFWGQKSSATAAAAILKIGENKKY
jgi:hypothetical protein